MSTRGLSVAEAPDRLKLSLIILEGGVVGGLVGGHQRRCGRLLK